MCSRIIFDARLQSLWSRLTFIVNISSSLTYWTRRNDEKIVLHYHKISFICIFKLKIIINYPPHPFHAPSRQLVITYRERHNLMNKIFVSLSSSAEHFHDWKFFNDHFFHHFQHRLHFPLSDKEAFFLEISNFVLHENFTFFCFFVHFHIH